MRTTMRTLAVIAVCYCLFSTSACKKTSTAHRQKPVVQYKMQQLTCPLNVVTVQDCSGSITDNGIDLISPTVFAPYYEDTHRDIQLSFGIISSNSAHSLITVELPALWSLEPIAPDLSELPLNKQNEAKYAYWEAITKYKADTQTFYTDRRKRYLGFYQCVNSALAPYRSQLSQETDLTTAVNIADRQLFYWHIPNAANYLLLLSDGFDSNHRTVQPMKSKAEVILVNANGNKSTNLDRIVTRSMVSVQQAISFTLNNHY